MEIARYGLRLSALNTALVAGSDMVERKHAPGAKRRISAPMVTSFIPCSTTQIIGSQTLSVGTVV
ncbi:Hypothetical Protein RSKD131_3865 [Cereibacter sphaeroides KD131]|nr:Hypothetical Protein RSKD131_3865 [Cereibacter sphaeroides KD131]